jgi:acetyl esterase/lipase
MRRRGFFGVERLLGLRLGIRFGFAFTSLVAVAAAALSVSCGAPEAHLDVPYDARFGDATTMDVYVPDADGRHAGVMFIHGGGWTGGSKAEYTLAAKRLARSGWVTATINYRLVPDGVYPKLVQDCVCAMAFLRANAADYKLDPDRLAVMGYSAGGHLVSLLGVATDDPLHAPDCEWGTTAPPRAVIAGAGWQDFRGQHPDLFGEIVGASEAERPDLWAHISPITHVRPGLPPMLFINGSQDVFVHLYQARAMRDALVAAGNDATVLEIAGGGHLLNRTVDDGDLTLAESDLTSEAWITVTDFLERTMGPP